MMGGRNKSDEGERDKRDRVETRFGSVSLTGEEREIESFFLSVAWPCNFEELREPQFREVNAELAS